MHEEQGLAGRCRVKHPAFALGSVEHPRIVLAIDVEHKVNAEYGDYSQCSKPGKFARSLFDKFDRPGLKGAQKKSRNTVAGMTPEQIGLSDAARRGIKAQITRKTITIVMGSFAVLWGRGPGERWVCVCVSLDAAALRFRQFATQWAQSPYGIKL